MALTDADLVLRASKGDQSACGELVSRHQRSVFNLAFRLLGDSAAAEDVSQDTFLKAFRRLETFDPTRRFPPWLLRIAHNTAVDALRRRPPDAEPFAAGLPVAAPARTGPLAEAERAQLRDALDRALDRLRPEHRAAIVLRYQEGLSHTEIAQVMGIPEGTAKTHVHRARRRLAVVLRDDGFAD